MKTKEELDNELLRLKEKHKTVYTITIPIDDSTETRTIYLKKLDKQTFSAVMAISQADELQSVEFILKNQYIGGDNLDEILNDDDLFLACRVPAFLYMNKTQGTLKKN